tara:strand:+ start:246 stop:1367 length:1122 start_codon:yes stop_codon:yes gene_type:complete
MNNNLTMNRDNNSTNNLNQEFINAVNLLQRNGATVIWPNASQDDDSVIDVGESHLFENYQSGGSSHRNDTFAESLPPPPAKEQEEKSKVQTQDLNNGTSPILGHSNVTTRVRLPINPSDPRIGLTSVNPTDEGKVPIDSGSVPNDMPGDLSGRMSGGVSGGTPIGMSTGGGGRVSGSTDTHSGASSKKPTLMDAIKCIRESNPDSYFAGSYFPEDVLRIFRNANVTYMKVFAYFVNTPHGPWTYFGKTFNKKEEWDKFFKEYTFYVTHDVIPSNMFFESVGTVFSISKLEEFGMRTELTYDEKKRYGLVSNAVIVPKKQPENKTTHKVKEVKDEYLENHIIYNGMPMVMGCGYVTSYPSYGGFSFQSGNYIMS